MTIHTIMLPDMIRGREPRSVIWDDEAGTVTGEHYDVPWMQEMLERPTPVDFSNDGIELALLDPAHDPRDFMCLLRDAYWPIYKDPDRQLLPPALRDVEPREPKKLKHYSTLPDGTKRLDIPGLDYLD